MSAKFGDPRLPRRFWSKVRIADTGCWEWTASRFWTGYGQFRGRRSATAHREAYIALVADVPAPLVLDHLCRVPHCVNPDHLEPVTQQVNVLRGDLPSVNVSRSNRDMCRNGLHPWTAENMKINSASGKAQCRPCLNASTQAWRERKRAAQDELSRTG